MRRFLIPLFLSLLAFSGLLGLIFLATMRGAEKPAQLCGFKTSPVMRQGEKWRLGYLQGGAYSNYGEQLKSLANALESMGWLAKPPYPKDVAPGDAATLWRWLARHVRSDYLDFREDAFYDARWDDAIRAKTKAGLLARLKRGSDIDLMLAAGTWAGQDLANNQHSTPTVVFAVTDPVRSGIVKSAGDSGFDHLHVDCDPDCHRRQIRAFHNIFRFKRLGVVCEDSPDGRVWACLDELEELSKAKGFALVVAYVPETNIPKVEASRLAKAAIAALAPRIDALWLSEHNGLDVEFMPDVLAPAFAWRLPTWSIKGAIAARSGALLAMSDSDRANAGRANAQALAAAMNGAKPRDLPQGYASPKALAFNLKAAERIGYTAPHGLFVVAGDVFNRIEGPNGE